MFHLLFDKAVVEGYSIGAETDERTALDGELFGL